MYFFLDAVYNAHMKAFLTAAASATLFSFVFLAATSGNVGALTLARPLSQGMQGDDVKTLQQYLKDHGYLVGWQATGLYGAATADAVAQFQQDNGLEFVGSVGLLTLALLNRGQSTLPTPLPAPTQGTTSATPAYSALTLTRGLKQGYSGPDVSALQQFLKDKGFYTYPEITGYYGTSTMEAVAAFQRTQGIPPLGGVGPQTRAALNALSAAAIASTQIATDAKTDLINSLLDQVKVLQARLAELIAARDGQTSACAPLILTRALDIGAKGTDVSRLQQFLKDKGFYTYPEITGYFGPITAAAAKAFQAENGIEAIGTVGPKTRAKITAVSAVCSPSASSSVASTRSLISNDNGLRTSTATSTIALPWPGFGGGGGGGGVRGGTVSVTRVPDTVSPSVILSYPSDGSVVAGANVTLSADASDNVAIAGVTFKVDGVAVGSEITSAPYTMLWNSTTVTSGSHTIAAVARDTSNNSVTSSAITVTVTSGTTYYVSPSGNDGNSGTSPYAAWQSISKVNGATFGPGDILLFQGGQTFDGCLTFTSNHVLSTISTAFTVGSYGTGKFTLQSNCTGYKPNQVAAVKIAGVSGIVLQDTIIRGNNGDSQYGVWIINPNVTVADGITVQRTDISGFYATSTNDYGAEIFVTSYPHGLNHVSLLNNVLHGSSGPTSPDDNGISGWSYTGKSIQNVLYQGNTVYDIGGKANGIAGAVGNGILANGVDGGVLQNNVVHDLGANVTTCGGPGGVWAYNSNNITIQFNEAYDIQPVPYVSGCDWTGYDLDSGVTNSTVQYNYSHDNYGAGYLLFAGSAWGPNTVRYNISERDARVNSAWTGSITIAGSDGPVSGVANIYNNTVWQPQSGAPAINNQMAQLSGGIIANNIIAAGATGGTALFFNAVNGANNMPVPALTFENNDYYKPAGGRVDQESEQLHD